MQYISEPSRIERDKPSVVALGNFDGVHRGHQKLFKLAKEESQRLNIETIVFSFYPHPTWVVGGKKKSLIMSQEEKRNIIESIGIDVLIEYPFTKDFANMPPEEFFVNILVNKLHTKVLVVGSNYYFGKGKQGGVELLKELGERYNVKVVIVDAVLEGDEIISSSRIRKLISSGNIEMANKLAGHPYSVSGTIVKGNQLGRKLGFPTINIMTEEYRAYPPNGVYATKVYIDKKQYLGITNIGYAPTVDVEVKRIETYIYDFNEDVYGKHAKVEFYKFIRPERKFNSIDELKSEVDKNKQQVTEYFSSNYQ